MAQAGSLTVAIRTPAAVLAGFAALGAIGILVGGAFVGLVAEALRNPAGALGAFDAYLFRIARFTLWQAALSTLLSALPAIAVAHAINCCPDFPGRGLILRLFALPLALPAIVAALAWVALLGRSGFLAPWLSALTGGEWQGIYGVSGILLAHVFFNLPLAVRLFVQALDNVPSDQWRLASQLGMKAGSSFRLIEWPAIRSALPGVAGLVFMLCVTSFTIVLTLGGGPRASTIEVAIYQALRFDFDPSRAVALTLVQVILTLMALSMLAKLGADTVVESAIALARRRFFTQSKAETLLNGCVIAIAALFVVAPFIAIVASGLEANLSAIVASASIQQAAVTSLVLSFLAAALAVVLAWAVIAARWTSSRRLQRSGWLEFLFDRGASLVLVVPPIVIGSGWFMLLRTSTDVLALAPLMVVTVNAVMAMPFAMRAIRPAYDAAAGRHDRIASQLGISGWNRLRLIDWPSLRRSVATAFVFAMALSMGDLGVIALFGSDAVQTLPYVLLARMGSYRTADAAGIALILAMVCLGLTVLSDLLGRGGAE
jgi:thiamine transport system permease protein